MGKGLEEMPLEELWMLFPIRLVEHNDEWETQYREMAGALERELSPYRVVRISWIGSTAVRSIRAKPIVDILLEIAPCEDMAAVAERIVGSGFIKMAEAERRASFNCGYTESGFAERVFHLHLRYAGDNDELYFRDYLIDHPDAAREYEQLKLRLWRRYEHDRDAYTEGKTAFVKKHTADARREYGDRY